MILCGFLLSERTWTTMFKIGDILMLEPKYTPQKEKFNCMVVEMGTGCFYTDFPIDSM